MTKRESRDVFRYTREKKRATVRRHYFHSRRSQGAWHCDNPDCVFNKEPPVWNGQDLPLTLDHINGVNSDDELKNLRLLCPNCNAQQKTHGGRNKGMVEKAEGGFAIRRSRSGLRDIVLLADPGNIDLEDDAAEREQPP